MRRFAPAVLCAWVTSLVACGPQRDTDFKRIVQFSAVTKLQVSGTHVYFLEGTAFERVAVDGGSVELVSSDFAPNDFAVWKSRGYLATQAGVVVFDLLDLTVAAQQVSNDAALAIAADESGVTWLDCNALVHAQPDGSGQLRVPLDASVCAATATRLAIDSSTAYGVDTKGLWYASRSGGPIARVTQATCDRLQAGGGWVYCANALNLVRIDPLVGDYQVVDNSKVRDFVLSPDRIYGADEQNLFSQPRSGSGQAILGVYADISAVTVDDDACYFVNTAGNLGLLLSTAL